MINNPIPSRLIGADLINTGKLLPRAQLAFASCVPPIDFLAGETHFMDHLYPIWAALPDRLRGTFYAVQVGPSGHRYPQLRDHVVEQGYEYVSVQGSKTQVTKELFVRQGRPVVVASVVDMRLCQRVRRPVVFCEHGSGQTYGGRIGSYAGGSGRDGVVLFLCPNESVQQKNQHYYPRVPSVVVGCPKLDAWAQPLPAGPSLDKIAISFHWPCGVSPESGTAWDHFKGALLGLVEHFGADQLLGHAHPRMLSTVRPAYERLGIQVAKHFGEVVARASLYVCDNSSTIFEFARLGRPVVVLNSPKYRRDVSHGLRFWEYADVGVQCDEPGDLIEAIVYALTDPPEVAARRLEISELVYPYWGQSTQLAVEALTELVAA